MNLNLFHRLLLGTLPLLLSMPLVANAQNNGLPQPNRQGDYTSFNRKYPHLAWKVVSSELNCRSQPALNSRVISVLPQNYDIYIAGKAKVYRDRQGKPWFYISGTGSAEDVKNWCFVRANSQFIEPVPYDL